MKAKNLTKVLHNVSKETGIGKIYIRYSHFGNDKVFPTTVSLHRDKWDKKEKSPKPKALTGDDAKLVNELYDKIAKLIRHYQFNNDNVLPPIAYIEEHITKKEHPTSIYELFDQYIEHKKKRTSDGTITNYRYAGDLLKEVDDYYKYYLSLHNFNQNFIEKFINYCQNIKKEKNSSNTVRYRIDIYKGFVRYLNRNKIKHAIEFEHWEDVERNETGDLICLEREELDEILAYTPNGKREQKIRDIIVWLSHTGMRISDIKRITKNHVIDDCIDFIPQKVREKDKSKLRVRAVVPISKPVRDILERYNYKPPYMDKSNVNESIRLFCSKFTSLQKIVRHIKVDGSEVTEEFVPKHSILSSHDIGRKTFTNLVIQKGVPIPILMGYTGHQTMDIVIKSYLNKYQNSLPHLKEVFEF